MIVIGLTGGVGMGKSTSAKLLRELGCAIVDTDQIARDIVEPGEPALAEIVESFGAEMLGDDGRLRRDSLARCVFADEAKRHRLEGMLHPRIRHRWREVVSQWRGENRRVGAVVIPLLYETGAENEFDKIVCVACSEEVQRRRLMDRGWGADQIDQRIAAQWPISRKMDRSDFVVWTDGSMERHADQVERIWKRFQ